MGLLVRSCFFFYYACAVEIRQKRETRNQSAHFTLSLSFSHTHTHEEILLDRKEQGETGEVYLSLPLQQTKKNPLCPYKQAPQENTRFRPPPLSPFNCCDGHNRSSVRLTWRGGRKREGSFFFVSVDCLVHFTRIAGYVYYSILVFLLRTPSVTNPLLVLPSPRATTYMCYPEVL